MALDVGRNEQGLHLFGFDAPLVQGQTPLEDLGEAIHQCVGVIHQEIAGLACAEVGRRCSRWQPMPVVWARRGVRRLERLTIDRARFFDEMKRR